MEHIILAANGGDFFTSTDLGKAVASIMKAVALIVVLIAAVKGIKDAIGGKFSKAVQTIIGAAVVVTFLWQPSLIGDLINLFSNLVGKSVSTVNDTTR